jgi:hypothetical protein
MLPSVTYRPESQVPVMPIHGEFQMVSRQKFHAIHQQNLDQILAQILWTLLHVKLQLTGLKKTDSSLPPLNRMRTPQEQFVFISPTLFNTK